MTVYFKILTVFKGEHRTRKELGKAEIGYKFHYKGVKLRGRNYGVIGTSEGRSPTSGPR